jgi:hypothetical protein
MCVLFIYYGSTIFKVYTDNTFLLGPDKKEIEEVLKKLIGYKKGPPYDTKQKWYGMLGGLSAIIRLEN